MLIVESEIDNALADMTIPAAELSDAFDSIDSKIVDLTMLIFPVDVPISATSLALPVMINSNLEEIDENVLFLFDNKNTLAYSAIVTVTLTVDVPMFIYAFSLPNPPCIFYNV